MPDREIPKRTIVSSSRARQSKAHASDANAAISRATPDAPDAPKLGAPAGRPVVIVGAAADIPRALAHSTVVAGHFFVVAAIAVDVADEARGDWIDDIERLDALLRSEMVTTVLVAGPVGARVMQQLTDLAVLHRCELLAVMPSEVLSEHEPVVVGIGDASLIELAGIKRHAWAPTLKRAIDVVVATLGLLITAPIMALVAIAIRLESAGSPVFRHERIGYRGKPFLCLKLRTMRVDAEECLRADSAMYEEYRKHHFKIPEDRDPRVTKLGRWLRRTSIDELPQLWNVLIGEMSLVGPRPVVTEELEMYGREKSVMLSVRPGITGAWAVAGRQSLGYPERCAIELRYVRSWRLSGDVKILARTLWVVGRSAFAA
jgi:exopolysaccharide production protein ExoY